MFSGSLEFVFVLYIILIPNEIQQAKQLLNKVIKECCKVGFYSSYTPMIRKVFNQNALDKIKNEDLWRFTTYISSHSIQMVKISRKCISRQNIPAHQLVTWIPAHGKMSFGKPSNTFIDTLLKDTELRSSAEHEKCMEDRALLSQHSSSLNQHQMISKRVRAGLKITLGYWIISNPF